MSKNKDETTRPEASKTFVRTASGLVRVFSTWDVFMYSVLAMVVMTTGMWVYIQGPFAWPGANVPVGILITTIWGSAMIIVYAMLTSSMPRSGGEYVWQSRLIHPALGFAVTFVAWPLVGFYWGAEGAVVLNQMGLSPMFLFLSTSLKIPALLDLANWLNTNTGIIAVGTILNVSVFLLLLPGLKRFLKIQWLLFFGLVASWITILAIFLTSNNASFISAFNSHMLNFNPGMTNAYQQAIDTATSSGFATNPSMNLFGTFGILPLAWWSLSFPMLVTLNAGEIKGADNLKRMSWVLLASLFFCGIYMALVGWASVNVVGYQFQHAISAGFFNGNFIIPTVFPFYTSFAAMLTTNPIVIILVFIGIIFNCYQLMVNVWLSCTRVLVSQSFDRITPAWISGISKRWPGTPINSYWILFVGVEIVLFVYSYISPYILVSMYVIVFSYLMTMVAGLVFPFRKSTREIWKASPAAKWRTLISVIAAIAIPFLILQLYYYSVTPALGLASVPVLVVMWSWVVICIIYYYIRRYQLRRKAIDLDLNFKMVPPA